MCRVLLRVFLLIRRIIRLRLFLLLLIKFRLLLLRLLLLLLLVLVILCIILVLLVCLLLRPLMFRFCVVLRCLPPLLLLLFSFVSLSCVLLRIMCVAPVTIRLLMSPNSSYVSSYLSSSSYFSFVVFVCRHVISVLLYVSLLCSCFACYVSYFVTEPVCDLFSVVFCFFFILFVFLCCCFLLRRLMFHRVLMCASYLFVICLFVFCVVFVVFVSSSADLPISFAVRLRSLIIVLRMIQCWAFSSH